VNHVSVSPGIANHVNLLCYESGPKGLQRAVMGRYRLYVAGSKFCVTGLRSRMLSCRGLIRIGKYRGCSDGHTSCCMPSV
jgi:hypothetical protein